MNLVLGSSTSKELFIDALQTRVFLVQHDLFSFAQGCFLIGFLSKKLLVEVMQYQVLYSDCTVIEICAV